jgi:hypothetical protein
VDAVADLPPSVLALIAVVVLILVLKLLGFAAKAIGLIVIIGAAIVGALYATGHLPSFNA